MPLPKLKQGQTGPCRTHRLPAAVWACWGRPLGTYRAAAPCLVLLLGHQLAAAFAATSARFQPHLQRADSQAHFSIAKSACQPPLRRCLRPDASENTPEVTPRLVQAGRVLPIYHLTSAENQRLRPQSMPATGRSQCLAAPSPSEGSQRFLGWLQSRSLPPPPPWQATLVEGGPNYGSSLPQHRPGVRPVSEQTMTWPTRCPALRREQGSAG